MPPPPPTRKEQLQLDELLSDIYRGIEALPDKSAAYSCGNNNSAAHTNPGTYGTYQFNKSPPSSLQGPSSSSAAGTRLVARTHVKEYELPASSPLVKQHLAALREDLQSEQRHQATSSSQHQPQYSSSSGKQPQRSTLKRNTTNTPDIYNKPPAQSLASFVTSTPTPENKRRVRIVDQPESFDSAAGRYRGGQSNNDDDYADYEHDDDDQVENRQQRRRPEKVKYVNTNKLIYHQEKNPDELSPTDATNNNLSDADNDDEELGEGKTRVEYYHTTWLDRQLGRASKRRSSKELNERQVKEKAMIEELKRSLKSGAITLRQSLRGNKKHNKHNSGGSAFIDDYQPDYDQATTESLRQHRTHSHHHHSSPSKHHQHKSNPIGSGLATIPRNYGSTSRVYYPATPVCYDTWVNKTRAGSSSSKSPVADHHRNTITSAREQPSASTRIVGIEEPRNSYSYNHPQQQQQSSSNHRQQPATTPKQTSSGNNFLSNNNNNNYNSSTLNNRMQSQYQTRQLQAEQTPASILYSRTLPHKSSSAARRGEHSLIESHLRGGGGGGGGPNRNFTLEQKPAAASNSSTLPYHSSTSPAAPAARATTPNTDSMRNPGYASPAAGPKSPLSSSACTMDRLRQRPGQDTVGNIPSATEVVRSALSRSSSQVSLNQLNKTINLLPNSPPPYSPSPSAGHQTPTEQQLKQGSVAVSPSPSNKCNQHQPGAYNSAAAAATATPTTTHQRLYGTRTLDRPSQQQQQAAANPNKQPIYANPHASLMQHRAEQQARQTGGRNAASIREFNELDNLLRSLSPAAAAQRYPSSTHITPGFSAKPAQSSIGGYGFTAPAAAATAASNRQPTGNESIYARVQKPAATSIYQTPTAAAAPATDQTKASYLHQNYALANQHLQQSHQPYTIDVTNKRMDENCFKRQDLSEFEAPIELLPSMEDYQNITKLNPVKNHYWYKPNMSRDRAISLLKDKPQGTFIVRDSTSFRGAYGLALKVAKLPKNVLNNASLRNFNSNDPTAELIRHFLIEPTPSGVRLKGYENEPVFNSLPDLIYQHSLTELALPCRLIIPRTDIEDPNFNYKQKQFFDDFVASKEQAKHLPYERTSPDGGYRKYPGDVYVHNEHRIIFE